MRQKTLFVTGGSGFIGSEFVRQAIRAGHLVQVLTRSDRSAERIRALGAVPVSGDLLQPGPWQTTAAEAHVVVHLAQPETYGGRVTRARAESFRQTRVGMDANLFDALTDDRDRRIVYVGGTSYYGSQGERLVGETTIPHPKGWGPYIAPAIEAVERRMAAGWPIVLAFPSWVYGPGSWFIEYTVDPLLRGKRIVKLAGPVRTISFVHVEDVARALLHLIDQGELGTRYFVTDDRPSARLRIGEIAAQALSVPMRVVSVPLFVARLVTGPVIADSLLTEARLSNERLKTTGFALRYPTLEQGVPHTIETWRQLNPRGATPDRG
jgi:nucleoside-diphosphate-sugar epimerase